MQIFKLSDVWNEERPGEHTGYDGCDISLPLYEYITIEPDQLRLLHLQPGTGRDRIHFELKTATRRDFPEYEAVSYCWGEFNHSCNIACNGTRLPVTNNGIDALWHFRLPNKPRVLWMDAVCINQKDDQEKSEQVIVMDEIYSGAHQTLAWAGNDAKHAKTAFTFLADLLNVVKNDIVIETKTTKQFEMNSRVKAAVEGTEDWVAWAYLFYCLYNVFDDDEVLKGVWRPAISLDHSAAQDHSEKLDFKMGLAIRKLCDREYFHRCWVLQELVLSKRSILCIGRNSMPWDDFAAMIWIISRTSRGVPGLHPAASSIVQMQLRRTYRELFRDGAYQFSVLQSSLIASSFKATKEVDRIYAMRNLGTKQAREAILVDYKQLPVETYLQVGQSMMLGSPEEKAANIAIALPYLRFTSKHDSGSLPSWIPDFEALETADGRMMALQSKFHAGGESEHLETAFLHPESSRVLCLRGIVTDAILSFAGVEPRRFRFDHLEVFEFPSDAGLTQGYSIPTWSDFLHMISPNPPKAPFRNEEIQALMLSKMRLVLSGAIRLLQAMRNVAGEDMEDTFWRAVQADQIHQLGQRAPKDKPYPGLDVKFLDATPSLSVPSNWTHSHPVLQSTSQPGLRKAYDFLSDLEPWCDARFGRTQAGNLAWMPAKAKLTDSICLFGGTSTFHVIRPDGSGRWKIIGPAYVQGLMNGEAVPSKFNDDDFLLIS